MNTFKGMVSGIMQKWQDHSSGNSWLHFELFLARYCEFKDRKGLYSSSEAQSLQALTVFYQFCREGIKNLSCLSLKVTAVARLLLANDQVCVWASACVQEAFLPCALRRYEGQTLTLFLKQHKHHSASSRVQQDTAWGQRGCSRIQTCSSPDLSSWSCPELLTTCHHPPEDAVISFCQGGPSPP